MNYVKIEADAADAIRSFYKNKLENHVNINIKKKNKIKYFTCK